MNSLLSRLILALGFTASANACYAGSITASLLSADNHGVVKVHMNAAGGDSGFFTYNITGGLQWETKSTSGAGPFPDQYFRTFCIDVKQSVNLPGGPYSFDVSQTLVGAPLPVINNEFDAAKERAVQILWARHYGSTVNDTTTGAAFQLALWRIEYDWSGNEADLLDFEGGNFRTKSSLSNDPGKAAIVEAKAMLHWVLGEFDNLDTELATGLLVLRSNTHQDQITQIPEPTTMSLAAIGVVMMSGAAGYRRWKKQTPVV